MNFIDEAEVHVKAGDGGAGAVAFRREKFIPRGGPSGGDGGDGADIVLETDERLTTLLDFRFKREYVGRNGEPGRGRDQNGHGSPAMVLKVPPGTLVRSLETGEILADLRENGLRHVLAQGGKGGLGNMNFATPTLQAPRFSQPGTEGEEKRVRLELRLLADVGLVGFPNAGKSTLVARLSRARPKIADYPFTTLQPHLGVVQYKDARSFVLTDLPGLIEGAHLGAGLGTRFLKHMQRCRAVIHLLDASSAPLLGRDLIADFDAINRELALFDPALGRKAQIVAANKIDVPEGRAAAEAFKAALARRGLTVHLISGATGEGMEKLLDAVVYELDRAGPAAPLEKDLPGHGLPPEEDVEDVDPGEPGAGGEQAAKAVSADAIETEEELEAAIAVEEAAKAAVRAKTVFRSPLANEPLRLEDVEPPAPAKSKASDDLLEDERAESAQEKQKRAPKITGRRKDGMFKEKAAKSEQPLAGKFKPTSEAAQALLQSASRRGGGARAVVPAVRTLGPVVRGPKPKPAAAKPLAVMAKATVKAAAPTPAKATAKKAVGKKAAPKKPIGKLGASEAAQKRTLAKAQAQAQAAAEKKLGKRSPTSRAAEAFKAKLDKSKAKTKNKKVLPPSKRRSAKSRRAPNQ